MSTKQIKDFTEKTTPVDTDILLLQQTDNACKKVAVVNLRQPQAYACMYVNKGSTAQIGVGTSPTLLTCWASDGADGLESGADANQANNRIVLSTAGKYLVLLQTSFSGSVSARFEFELYLNSSPIEFRCDRTLGTGGDVGSSSIFGLVDASANDILEVYVNADGASKSITIEDAQLIVDLKG